MRHLVDAPATFEVTYLDGESVADPGVVTVEVTRDDGTEVTTSAVSGTGTSTRSVTVTAADNDQVDRLTATWTSSTLGVRRTYHDIVGGFYVTLRDIAAAGDVGDRGVAEMEAAREWAETKIDGYVGTAFVPRYGKYVEFGKGLTTVLLPARLRRILWATIDGTAQTLDDWDFYAYGQVYADVTFTRNQRVEVGYEYGWDAPPADIQEVALVLARHKLLEARNKMFDRARTVQTDFGVEFLSTPGDKRPTGLPGVDQVLNAYRDSESVPTVA